MVRDTEEKALLIKQYLCESNAIENVYGKKPLQDSLKAWTYIQWKNNLSEKIICEAHRLIMKRLHRRIAGQIRKCNVYVAGQMKYSPEILKQSLKSWLVFANSAATREEIRESHVWFEFIHPFEDGNGRVGRLLMLWQREKAGLPVDIILASEKQKYYWWFNDPILLRKYSPIGF